MARVFVFKRGPHGARAANGQPPCFRRLLQSLQYFGHFSALVLPAAFISFHSALHFLRRSLKVIPDLSSAFFLAFSFVGAISAAARSTGRIMVIVPARNAADRTAKTVRFNMDETPSYDCVADRPGPGRRHCIQQPWISQSGACGCKAKLP